MKIIRDVKQGSKEWHSIRLGRVTASMVKNVMSKGKAYDSYMAELITEIMTGSSKPFFENDAMRWGVETEDQARAMYELNSGNAVDEVAFIEHSEYVGVSPDGLVGDKGLLEIKCPTSTTQVKRALSGKYSEDYKAQIQMQLWVSNREWCDFLSFDPRIDCSASYLLERVFRDDDYIAEMEVKTISFVENMIEQLNKLTK